MEKIQVSYFAAAILAMDILSNFNFGQLPTIRTLEKI
jgi:hypothetical protein